MNKQLRKLVSIILAVALVITSLMPAQHAEAKAKTYVTRADVLASVTTMLGATRTTTAIKKVKDVKKKDAYYKTMSVALEAGLVTPSRSGKLYPTKKATYAYVSDVIAKVLQTTPDRVLGKHKGSEYLTKAQLKNFLAGKFPNVIKKSTSKVKKGSVIIQKPGVVLKNTTVKGDLVVGDGVGTKEATLSNVNVTGRLVVRGGGEHSIIIKGTSKISKVILRQANNKVSLKISGDAKVSAVYINDGCNDVNIVGSVSSLTVRGSNMNISLTGADVANVTVADSAKNITFTADKNSEVSGLTVRADNTTINGEGKYGKIDVKADNTTINAAIDKDKINIADDAKNTIIKGDSDTSQPQTPSKDDNTDKGNNNTSDNSNNDSANETPNSGSNNGSSSSGSTGGGSSSGGSSSGGSSSGGSSSGGSSSGGSSSGGSSSGGSSSGGSSSGGSSSGGSSSGGSSSGGSSSGGSSSGGSTGDSNNNNTPTNPDDPFADYYAQDDRFADGYPKIELDATKDQIKVIYKLKDGFATKENPAEIYNVMSTINGGCPTTTEAVLHGHLGKGTIDTGNLRYHQAILANKYGYLKITDSNEYVYTCNDFNTIGSLVVYSVIKIGDKVSEKPTKILLDKDTTESLVQTQKFPPSLLDIYSNKAGDTLYAYVSSDLDVKSVPDTSCFTISEANDDGSTSSDSTRFVPSTISIYNETETYEAGAYIELKLPDDKHLDPDKTYQLTYTVPKTENASALQDNANIPNKMEDFLNEEIKKISSTIQDVHCSTDDEWISFELTGRPREVIAHGISDLKILIDDKEASICSYNYVDDEATIFIKNPSPSKDAKSHQISISPKNNTTCQNRAFDNFTPVNTTFNPEQTRCEDLTFKDNDAIYHKSSNTITWSNAALNKNKCPGCLLTVKIGDNEYVLRGAQCSCPGTSGYSLAHLNINPADITEMQIKYTAPETSDNTISNLYNQAGKPAASSEYISVKIEDN